MSRGGSTYLHEEVGKKRNDDEDNVLLHNGLKNDAGSRQRLSVLIFELLELLGVTGAKRFHSILLEALYSSLRRFPSEKRAPR